MKSREAYKTIGEVCDIVGLVDTETGKRKTHVLRFWEKHFNEIKNGDVQVIVTDGFTGNVALKTAEGTANFITTEIKKSFSSSILSKIGYLFSYFAFKEIKKKLDPRKYNGAIFLGLNAPVIKSHGGADAFAFYNSLNLSYQIINGNLINKIKNNFISNNVK